MRPKAVVNVYIEDYEWLVTVQKDIKSTSNREKASMADAVHAVVDELKKKRVKCP